MRAQRTRVALLGLLCLAGACSEGGGLEPQSSSAALTSYQVGAIQYYRGQASQILPSCASAPQPDGCGVQELVKQAKQQVAILVVVPEEGLEQDYNEPDPSLGDNPGTDSSWPQTAPYTKMFSQQAKQLGITIVIHLFTQATGVSKPYGTQIALGPDGSVVGKHHKFELYDFEKKSFTPGTDVEVFDSPQLGKVGLLICADIYGDLNLHQKLTDTLKARVVAFSSFWMSKGAANFQQSYAKNWGVWLIGANVSAGAGTGGGIFDPDGKELARTEKSVPSLLMAAIPAP